MEFLQEKLLIWENTQNTIEFFIRLGGLQKSLLRLGSFQSTCHVIDIGWKTAFRVCWYMNFNLIQIRKCIWIYDLKCTRHLLEHQDKYCFESISKGKNMRLLFANGIYFKVASQVNVKTQIELEIWANCSGHRRKKISAVLFLWGSDK